MAHQRFQQHFLQKQIKNIHTIQKFFVCGPNVMNLEIVNSLIRLGVNESKIIPV
jgi:Na+-transporting NADH:ubiquinone oxidoreductase subunit NqrF